jgi:hypothetical protein
MPAPLKAPARTMMMPPPLPPAPRGLVPSFRLPEPPPPPMKMLVASSTPVCGAREPP